MDNLVITSHGKDVTTSLIIAKIFGKRHDNVLRDILSMECSPEFRLLNFEESSYLNDQKKPQPMYEITKDGFSFLAMGYTGEKAAKFKEDFINEFNKREALLKNPDYIVGQAFIIVEQQRKQLEEINTLQRRELEIAAPKVEYHDKVLSATGTIKTTVIASELGMSAVALNELLHDLHIQRKVDGTWVLYTPFLDKGLATTETFPYADQMGNTKTSRLLVWTEAGRKFIHQVVEQSRSQEPVNVMRLLKTG